ncbi:MAG: DUF1501 domain-containing protein [Myxococcota bacterium]
MSNDFDRRALLKGLGAAGALAAFQGFGSTAHAGPIRPGGWGRRPDHFGMTREYKVLELFLYGGLSPWETFYVRPDSGFAERSRFTSAFDALTWSCTDVPRGHEAVYHSSRYFARDSASRSVYLGPATQPLWRSSRLVDRLRLIVMQHDLLPHEAAVPYAMTGQRLGSPRFSGLGAPISRRTRDLDPSRSIPVSYAIIPDPFFAADNLVATTAVGTHPSADRPLQLKIGDASTALSSRLTRGGATPERDRIVNVMRDAYADQMSWPGRGRLRSKHFDAYEASLRQVLNAPALSTLLPSSMFTIADESSCITRSPGFSEPNRGKTSLGLAAHLLAPAGANADYVAVVDNGRIQEGGAGYDVHSNLAPVTFINLYSILDELETLVAAGSIDLDETLIVINTEFGRTPHLAGSFGRDHYPLGYVVGMLGGPITSRGIAGSMTAGVLPEAAGTPFCASDVLGATLLAAGIDPTNNDIFGVGDFSGNVANAVGASGIGSLTDEEKVRRGLGKHILGLPL